MRRGLFIVLEGGDYTGKGVQSIKLAEHITNLSEGNDVLITHEPTWRAREIKRKLMEDKDAYSDAEKMAELYVEDRRIHTGILIEPNLNEGVIVIGNRYSLSTCIYQSLQGVALSKLIEMHKVPEILVPDLTILLDISPGTADERARKRGQAPEKKFEANRGFRNQVYQKYLEIALSTDYTENLGSVDVVDGNSEIEQVAEKVQRVFATSYSNLLKE